MQFRQPNELSRVMSQMLDQLAPDRVLTLEFASHEELQRGLSALHEVALARQLGVVVTPIHKHRIELRLAEAQAA